MAYDPNDPHQNPAADHLRIQASPEAVEAAEANAAAVNAVSADPAPVYGDKLTVAESQTEGYARLGVDAKHAVEEVEPEIAVEQVVKPPIFLHDEVTV